MAILPSIGLTFAESANSITTNQSVYEYGDQPSDDNQRFRDHWR